MNKAQSRRKNIYDNLPSCASHLIGDKDNESDEFHPGKTVSTRRAIVKQFYKSRLEVENMFGKFKD